MVHYLDELNRTGNSLMIFLNNELIFQSKSKGIKPYLEVIEKYGDSLEGSTVVDKIVGRAAALLIAYINAGEVYAMIVSKPGKDVLEKNGFHVKFGSLVEQIKMKDGRIYCPFERMVQGITNPREAYGAIIMKMKELESPP